MPTHPLCVAVTQTGTALQKRICLEPSRFGSGNHLHGVARTGRSCLQEGESGRKRASLLLQTNTALRASCPGPGAHVGAARERCPGRKHKRCDELQSSLPRRQLIHRQGWSPWFCGVGRLHRRGCCSAPGDWTCARQRSSNRYTAACVLAGGRVESRFFAVDRSSQCMMTPVVVLCVDLQTCRYLPARSLTSPTAAHSHSHVVSKSGGLLPDIQMGVTTPSIGKLGVHVCWSACAVFVRVVADPSRRGQPRPAAQPIC